MPKIDAQIIEKKTPIFTTIIDDYKSMNSHVKMHILEMKRQNPQGVESNVRAWRSHWFTHKITDVFNPLVELMTSACDFVSDQYYNDGHAKFEPFNFWVMDYQDGDETLEHNHFPSSFSVVYYVDVEDGCAPLIIEGETIQPKNGMLVVFPGHLDHEVPKNKGRRIAASGNFHLKPVDIYEKPPEDVKDKFKDDGFRKKVAAANNEDFYNRQIKKSPIGFKS